MGELCLNIVLNTFRKKERSTLKFSDVLKENGKKERKTRITILYTERERERERCIIKAHLKYLKYHNIYIYITISELNASVIIQTFQADGMKVEDLRGEPAGYSQADLLCFPQ